MAKRHVLPDGNFVMVPDDMAWAEADTRAQQQFPEAFGIQRQHGFMPAATAAFKESIASGIKGLANITDSETLGKYGQRYAKGLAEEQAVPGAYQPTTGEDVSAGFKKGILPGAGAWLQQHITEPVGGIVGGFALPTLAAGAAGIAAAPFIPEAGAIGLGARALSGLAKGAAFTGVEALPETGRNIAEQEAVQQQAAKQGLPVPEINKTNAVAAGLVQAAIIPVLGNLGGYVTRDVLKLLGPDIAATSRAVAAGQMTQEAAIAALNSTTKNILVRTGETAAIGVPMMVGTEALRMGQAGEDITGEEAQKRYAEAAEAGLALAPLGGAFGALARRGQVGKVEKAGEEFGKTWQEAQAQNAALDKAQAEQQAHEAAVQKWANAGVDTTIPMDLGKAPKANELMFPDLMQAQRELQYLQEQGAPLDAIGAKQDEIDALKKRGPVSPVPEEVTAEVSANPEVIQRSYMNALGVPNKSPLRELVGKPWGDSREDLANSLKALAEMEPDRRGTPAWLDKADKDTGVTPRQKIESELANNPKLQAQEVMEPVRTPEQTDFNFPTPEEQQEAKWQEMQAAMAAGRAQAKVAKTPGAVRDIFTGEPSVVDTTKPEEVPEAPSVGTPEARQALYDKMLGAIEVFGKNPTAKNKATLDTVMAQVRLNQGHQIDMFGRPIEEAPREPTRPAEPGPAPESRAGAEVPVPERAEPEPPAEQPGVVAGERPAEPAPVGKEGKSAAVGAEPKPEAKPEGGASEDMWGFIDRIPDDLTVKVKQVGADGKTKRVNVEAQATLKAATQRTNRLEALMECLLTS